MDDWEFKELIGHRRRHYHVRVRCTHPHYANEGTAFIDIDLVGEVVRARSSHREEDSRILVAWPGGLVEEYRDYMPGRPDIEDLKIVRYVPPPNRRQLTLPF